MKRAIKMEDWSGSYPKYTRYLYMRCCPLHNKTVNIILRYRTPNENDLLEESTIIKLPVVHRTSIDRGQIGLVKLYYLLWTYVYRNQMHLSHYCFFITLSNTF